MDGAKFGHPNTDQADRGPSRLSTGLLAALGRSHRALHPRPAMLPRRIKFLLVRAVHGATDVFS
jgi:hypothetical protein